MIQPTRFAAAAGAVLLTACAADDAGPERAAYLTLMGDDTLAVEWIEFGENTVDAQALVRGRQTTFADYHLERADDGTPAAYRADVYAGGSARGEPVRTEELVEENGERFLVVRQDGEERRQELEAGPGAVPFVDMLHWPFEANLRWQAEDGTIDSDVPTFTGRGLEFGLTENEDGTWELRHPSRGPSTVEIDPEGRILRLDGTGSTRAYDLRRMEYDALDPQAMGATFADRPLGELSGRGEIDDEVAGVRFTGHYGEPAKRGRDIFPGLLAYGTWWRTGANEATHLSFDRDIVIDGEVVPAGDYTLSSIPEEDGGTLIINRRTGQGGQSYDESMDQARVRMRRDIVDETIEVFEIRAVPADGDAGGRIELRWDDTVYWVPFSVR